MEILTTGLLRIRARSANAERVFAEADHLHNLPRLSADFRPELLDCYWSVEKPCFIQKTTPDDIQAFAPLSERLANLIAKHEIDAAP